MLILASALLIVPMTLARHAAQTDVAARRHGLHDIAAKQALLFAPPASKSSLSTTQTTITREDRDLLDIASMIPLAGVSICLLPMEGGISISYVIAIMAGLLSALRAVKEEQSDDFCEPRSRPSFDSYRSSSTDDFDFAFLREKSDDLAATVDV